MPSPLSERIRRTLREFAIHDWIVLGYLVYLLVFCIKGHGDRRIQAISWLSFDILLVFAAFFLTHRPDLVQSWKTKLIYRVSILFAILGSFLQMHYILPTATDYALDAQIYALDKSVFGFEPSEVWDQYITPATSDWFSFFYYGYFFLIGFHVFPMMFLEKRSSVMAEFAIGIVLVFCIGHSLYLLVPGFGPYKYLAPQFKHQLNGTFWWPIVKHTVESVDGAARKDIFPSLHTAIPSFLTLFSFRHKDKFPFKYTWPFMAFCVSQIIIATMFLRWHYLIDICAGLTLATCSVIAAKKIASYEAQKRALLGLRPIWSPLFDSETPSE